MNQSSIACGAVLLGSLLAADLTAQRTPPTQEKYASRKEAKLAEDWLTKADWILSYGDAKAAAEKTGKPIFAYFTRSYSP